MSDDLKKEYFVITEFSAPMCFNKLLDYKYYTIYDVFECVSKNIDPLEEYKNKANYIEVKELIIPILIEDNIIERDINGNLSTKYKGIVVTDKGRNIARAGDYVKAMYSDVDKSDHDNCVVYARNLKNVSAKKVHKIREKQAEIRKLVSELEKSTIYDKNDLVDFTIAYFDRIN